MHGHHHHPHTTSVRTLFAVAVLVSVVMGAGTALAQGPLAIPATFVRYVTVPGANESILRPTAMHYDRHHDELLVADFGHNRIVVFAPSGAYKFEFTLGGHVTAPRDITTDPDGFIYVLGSLQTGVALLRFDFDGVAMAEVPLPDEIAGSRLDPRSLACGDDGTLYLLDHGARRILVTDPIEGVLDWFPVGAQDLAADEMFGMGRLAVSGDELLVPVSTQGTVMRYHRDGTKLGQVGYFGAKAGTLNFPVAVEAVGDGKLLVLDRNRFCVVCYDADGRAVGEFGGKGHSPGWFINPTLLAIPSADQVVIGQIFENKIQVCDLPAFVSGRTQAGAEEDVDAMATVVARAVSMIVQQRRSTSHTIRINDSIRSGAATSQTTDPLSHLEVSE